MLRSAPPLGLCSSQLQLLLVFKIQNMEQLWPRFRDPSRQVKFQELPLLPVETLHRLTLKVQKKKKTNVKNKRPEFSKFQHVCESSAVIWNKVKKNAKYISFRTKWNMLKQGNTRSSLMQANDSTDIYYTGLNISYGRMFEVVKNNFYRSTVIKLWKHHKTQNDKDIKVLWDF